MDRRGFLTAAGTLGAASAGGWKAAEQHAADKRAAGLARAAGMGSPAGAGKAGPQGTAPPAALSVGYLPGSAGLLEVAARGQRWDPYYATRMRWAQWQPSLALPVFDPRLDISLGLLQSAQVWAAPDLLRSIEVVAHFAFDEAPYFAPFYAWRYDAPSAGKRARATAPLTFEAASSDRVGLQVNYAFGRDQVIPGLAETGTVYLPVGARDGPGIGLYVLATPSRITGARPDFAEYTFTGDLLAPLRRDTYGTPDFDFVTLTIAAA